MEGRTVKGLLRAAVAVCAGVWVLAFALPIGAATAAGTTNDTCGYASTSFTESTVVRWAQINGTGSGAQFVAYANDEAGLLLGVNGATPLSSATANGSNGQTGGTSFHVSNASGGSTSATDPSGRPFYPALFITDLTTNPLNANGTGAGDLQNGGTPRNLKAGSPFIDDVFGSWTTATLSGGTYTATKPSSQNHWNLGSTSDAPVGTTFSAMGDEGFGSEVRWNVSELTDSNNQALRPGHTYRIQIIEHDGDQNKAGGDAGEFCATLTIPGAKPALSTDAVSGAAGGTIHDVAHLSGGSSPTGTISFNVYAASDTTCSSPLNSSPLTTSVNGNGDYPSPNFTPAAAGSYHWVATYSGDASNVAPPATSCSDPREVSTVTKGGPALATQANSATAVGSPISDTATLSGGVNPTGTITWNVYASTDTSCTTPLNAQPSALIAGVSGNASYNSPNFTPTAAGSYKWVATYSGDGNNSSVSNSCTDPAEVSTVGKAGPALTTNAVSALVGQPIHDVAHLTGGSSPTGTITWNVYATSDTSCSTPLNVQPSALTATVNGDADYTSPDFTPSAAGTYQWVATYSGDSNNGTVKTACGDPNEVSTVTNNAAPAITLHKVERIAPSGSFTHGPVTGSVGDTVDYQIFVTNTGNTKLVIAFTDAQCDSGTLSAPSVVSGTFDASTNTLSASGGELMYTCSHVLAAGDRPYTNTASVVGTPPSGPPVSATDSVQAFANQPGIKVVKVQRDGTSGSFTTSPITASVGDTIFYRILVTNTGNTTLTLSLSDPHCDAGTVQGPISISGTLNGNTLAAGGVAQYTCSHVAIASDEPQFTNIATVIGQPPSGPPVHGTGIVVANITSSAIQVVKLEKDASGSGGFTRGPITVTEKSGHYVVHTIDYEIQVTNTGSTTLTLSLNDPHCDAGTIQGPVVIAGNLNGDVLSAGGQAQYTCSHRYVSSDPATFENVATVTGTPPNGPPVSGTSHVTVQRKTVFPKTKLCRTPTGRVIHYKGRRKPAACKFHPKPPKHPRGFTG